MSLASLDVSPLFFNYLKMTNPVPPATTYFDFSLWYQNKELFILWTGVSDIMK